MDTKIRDPAGVGRLGVIAAWVSAVCCLPYLVLKVLWTFDVPLGIADRSVLDGSDWVAGNALMALLQLAGLLLVLALTRSWARRLPTWLLLFPVWVGTGLLFQVATGAVLMAVSSASSQGSTASSDLGGIEPWVYVLVYSSFAGQGAALAIAFACHVRSRWGRILSTRTGDALATRATTTASWPEAHLAGIAEVVVVVTAAAAVLCGYWTAGGSTGGSGSQPDSPWALDASRLVGAATAVVGLLGVAGRWGRQRRFWLPVSLTWLGSGAMVAFDGLALVLFAVLASDTSNAGWSTTDTLLAVKVAIGVVAGAVGALALAVASKGAQPTARAAASDARHAAAA